MDTRDDGDDRRDDVDAHADRRGDPTRAPADPREDRRNDAENGDHGPDARDDGDDEVGIAEAVGEDRPPLGPLEPGSPTPENVLFVVLGALATVALVATLL
ncbi:hypothetical protein NDI76_05135 [Halogeometricum sp. S1BR25-6]|uniref:DUF7312 domain-containing protein n=1 Tax=Halogeometricum salsisoli TaxID=2950536 RepID=A0ABU2GD73_9EURY|nr:hypothetical protein [Halogeometricum sp. S1BR25-6]MDS0298119.1 hypothetical protein [Halogeometricum sp. S1BR25-6]